MGEKKRRLEFRDAAVVAVRFVAAPPRGHDLPFFVNGVGSSLVLEARAAAHQLRVAADDGAAFAAVEMLRCLKAEATDVADRADLLVTPFGQMRLAGVLNDVQAPLAGDGQNRIKVGDGPAQVNRQKGASLLGEVLSELPDLKRVG